MKSLLIQDIIENLEGVNADDWKNYINDESIKIRGCFNPFTKISYRGTNQFNLLIDFIFNKRKSNKYTTFKQIKEKNYLLKKGSTGVCIEYFNYIITHKKNNAKIKFEEFQKLTEIEKKEYQVFGFNKTYKVFNFDDIENYIEVPEDESEGRDIPVEENEFLNNLIKKNKINVHHYKNNVACYSGNNHTIYMPFKTYFKNNDAYLSTIFHEIIHWTGKDLEREKGRFGSKKYADEELIAELGSMLLMFEIENYNELKNSLCYLKGWLILAEDKVEQLSKLFGEAKKAVNFLLK